jgi:hypothetical protein
LLILNKDQFLNGAYEIAICGKHISGEAIHVGIAWKDQSRYQVFHFNSPEQIFLQNLLLIEFDSYVFSPIKNFDTGLIPSLATIAIKVSQNPINNFAYNQQGALYNGGAFHLATGDYNFKNITECIINCAVFVLGFLKAFDHTLINWDTFPNSNPTNLQANRYLQSWLDQNNVQDADREIFYKTSKIIRGRDILISSNLDGKPIDYIEIEKFYEHLSSCLKSIHFCQLSSK